MIIASLLQDCRLMQMPAFPDERGLFVKTFHDTSLHAAGIDFVLRESYYSISKKNVIRGMHFQTPPHEHSKIVFCPQGAILDVMLDMRKASPTFGGYHAEELSAANSRACYIPAGFAHGFKALTDGAMTYYLVTSEYHKECDAGIRWDSFGFDWNCPSPVMSERDKSFGTLADFQTPF